MTQELLPENRRTVSLSAGLDAEEKHPLGWVLAGILLLPEETAFELQECVEKTMEALAVRASQKGLELACHIAAEVPVRLIGDPGRLRQVLFNLVGNAIKFTDRGEVVVRVEIGPEGTDGGRCRLRFTVADTGIGIPADKLPMLFRSFSQIDASASRSHGGTGLGLAISRQIVERMGGRIDAESEPGRGSTFSFTVSFAMPAETPASECMPERIDLQDLHVIGLTAHAMPADRAKCLSAGMDDYLTKPIRPDMLRAAVTRHLADSRDSDPAADEVPADLAELTESVAGNGEFVREMVTEFLEACPGRLADFWAALRQGDGAHLELSAHGFKSVVAIFGARRAQRLAGELECMGRERRLEDAAAVLEQLESELERVRRSCLAQL